MNQASLKFTDEYPNGFWRWLDKNYQIYKTFERMAMEMARTGRTRYSARTIVERLRWDTDIQDTEKTLKINDHFTPGLARLFMRDHGKQYPRFFHLRDGPGT